MTVEGLLIRKLADTSQGRRLRRYNAWTGEAFLVDPDADGFDDQDPRTWEPRPWPLAGVEFEGGPPAETKVSARFVATGRAEGWLEVDGEEIVHAPGGPEGDPWRSTHTFVELDRIIFKTVGDGDVAYRVTRQPGRHGDEIHWSYKMERE